MDQLLEKASGIHRQKDRHIRDRLSLPRTQSNKREFREQGCGKNAISGREISARHAGAYAAGEGMVRGLHHPVPQRPVRRASGRWLVWLAAAVLGAPGWAAAAESVLDQAAALQAAGRLDEALDVLRVESREIKRVEGDNSPRLLAVNDLAAAILIDKGSLDTAAALLAKTIATREDLVAAGRTEQGPALGRSLLLLARLETSSKRLPVAANAARRALLLFGSATPLTEADLTRGREAVESTTEAIASLLGDAAEATRSARDEAAAACASLGMFSEAIEQRRKSLDGLLSAGGTEAAVLVGSSERLGGLMLVAGRSEEAIGIIEQVTAAISPARPEEATAMRRLRGELQFAADQLVLAAESFREALELESAVKKPAVVMVASDQLRGLLVALERNPEAGLPEWFDAAVKTLEKPPPTEVSAAIAGLVAASRSQEAIGNSGAAVEPLGRALMLANSPKSADAGRAAEVSARLAAVQLAAGDSPAARKGAERALPAAAAALGPGSAWVGVLRVMLADALAREGEIERAVTLANEAATYGLARPDAEWERRLTAAYDRLAATKGHEDLRERYLAMRARQFGPQHPHSAAAWSGFGVARLAAGDWPAAANCFAGAAAIQQASLGDDHPDTAASIVLLAHAERAAGKGSQAVETATRGLAAWERAAGRDHPGTLWAADVLVAASMQAGDNKGVVDLLERLSGTDALDPVRRASHLARLADLTAAADKARAKRLLAEAMQLPCWQTDADLDPASRRRLAFTAALAAHAYSAVGDPAAAKDSLQRARGLALQAQNPKELLDRVEQLASRGDQPVQHR